jgi:hypothetical protein
MSRIVIGKADGKDVVVDLTTLLPTRLLLQAGSGGGKSWAIRVLAEQFFGKVQVIIVDPEGEFATLREKYPYVLVGKGGETPADPRSAALVAHRLLELQASAVCDLYDLKSHLRHSWVKTFLDALIEAPKELRTPCVVVVDEAHMFCPEKGESEAYGSMVDLCTRGRKRGLCAVFATQRLAAAGCAHQANPGKDRRIRASQSAPCYHFGANPDGITPAQYKILLALARFHALGKTPTSKKWIAALAEVSHKSSGYANNLGALRSKGLIDYAGSSTAFLTPAGIDLMAGQIVPPDGSEQTFQHCLGILDPAKRKILRILFEAYPQSLPKQDVAQQAGVSPSSSGYSNNLGALRSAGMIEYGPGSTVRCADWIFAGR